MRHQPASGGEEATIEYAIVRLNIRDIIVCGRSRCGMYGLLNLRAGSHARTFRMAALARDILPDLPSKNSVSADDLLDIVIERNVLLQIAR